MRKLKLSALLLLVISVMTSILSRPSVAATAGSTPDILIQSKVDQVWSSYLIERLRTLFANTEVEDPFNIQFKNDEVVTSAILPSDLAPDQKEIFTELALSMGMDIDQSKIQVVTKGLSYNVAKVSPSIRPVTANGRLLGLQSDLDLSFSDVQVAAQEVDLSLMVAPKDGGAPFEYLKVALIKPLVHVDPTAVLDFSCRLKPVVAETMSFKVLSSSFVDLQDFLLKNDTKVAFSPGVVSMDPITLHVGPRTHVITAEKVSKIIDQNQMVIKKILITQFAEALTTGLGDTFLKLIFDQPYATDVWLPSEVYSKIKVNSIRDANVDEMAVDLSGSFCGAADFKKYGDGCEQFEKFWPDVRSTSADQLAVSKAAMTDVLSKKSANLVASVSEQYVNRLVRKTIEMGLWKDVLPKGADIGPLGGFLILDEAGDSFHFYLDLLYTGSHFDKAAIGKKTLRIPVSMKVSMKIVNHVVNGKDVPAISFIVHSADTSMDFLMKGLPEYGLISDMPHLRFKKKIAAAMTKELSPYYEKEILKIDFPVITGLGLEQAVFRSDGQGRALIQLQVGPL